MSESAKEHTHESGTLLPHGDAVEAAKAWVLCPHRGSLSLQNYQRRCEECGFVFTPSYSPTALEQAADALILAASAHGRAQTIQAVEQEARRRVELESGNTASSNARTHAYESLADFCRTQLADQDAEIQRLTGEGK